MKAAAPPAAAVAVAEWPKLQSESSAAAVAAGMPVRVAGEVAVVEVGGDTPPQPSRGPLLPLPRGAGSEGSRGVRGMGTGMGRGDRGRSKCETPVGEGVGGERWVCCHCQEAFVADSADFEIAVEEDGFSQWPTLTDHAPP